MTIGLLGLIALLILLVSRVPVAIALILVSFLGTATLLGWSAAFGILQNTPYSFVSSWTLSAVPMFLLMGFLAFHAGLTRGMYNAAKILLGWIPGGLAISSIFACSGFAAVCGSSIACAAAMGRVSIPEMVAAGYRPSFACGVVAAGGTIGALIPPSILMIVYGVFAETSITGVFLGGIGVGLLTAVSYSLIVLLTCLFRPDIAPRRLRGTQHMDVSSVVGNVAPVIALILVIFGGLFGGVFTATEAGAVGALGTLLICAATNRLDRTVISKSLLETLTTCAALFMVGVGASMFTRFLGISGISEAVASAFGSGDLDYVTIMVIIVIIYLALGTFMEPFGALLVTLPVVLPIIEAQGASLIWFGVLVVKLLEIGMITPPVGLNVFVIRSVAREYASTGQIFRGVAPFILADLVVVSLLIPFPGLILLFSNILN
ncbi:MAG: TRAP transporter large permease subunit [Mesorhizobium sp.]|uniref:TRAP transporter large permease n=1 Tax=Mesorhizobium sp. TaxID=1871066 RepID=UPI000FE9E17A|nr:TRAP transporter large permease subunit [Mesorhizobium sp.]RWI57100.1 MAG: TRAP transporter large permease subunit [Mesorhizobium sp.]